MAVYNISISVIAFSHPALVPHQGIAVTCSMGSAALAGLYQLVSRRGLKGGVWGANNGMVPFLALIAADVGEKAGENALSTVNTPSPPCGPSPPVTPHPSRGR